MAKKPPKKAKEDPILAMIDDMFEQELNRNLMAFITESNRIEGITLDPKTHLGLYRDFLKLKTVTIKDLCAFVEAIQPGAELRDHDILDRQGHKLGVRIGGYVPPPNGPHIRELLQEILDAINPAINTSASLVGPFGTHCAYENLHPFMDGNGRSGRAVWAWQMHRRGYRFHRLFLHEFYYQTLGAQQR